MSNLQPTGRLLARAGGHGRPAAPVRLVHLGLGNFFRAHQAWYTDRAPDAEQQWGFAAFSGRRAQLADALTAQDGLYTLITRTVDGDRFDVVSSISRAHAGSDHVSWLGYLSSPDVRAVTVTVTEAGYVRGADGGLDRARPAVLTDVAALRRDLTAEVGTAPARLVSGLAARRRADAGPITLVPCDNLPDNGTVLTHVIGDLAETVDTQLAGWIAQSVSVVSTVVDRIVPRTTANDEAAVLAATGVHDHCPVPTEPYHDWVLSGAFPGGRPRWDDAGAVLADDIVPYEERKLWLLNGAHSLLAYAGSARGHQTVADAVTDPTCRAWMVQWWTEASHHLHMPAADIDAYCAALHGRFANPHMHHRLAQVAADGSQKLPARILPVLRKERAAGRLPHGAARVLAAWVCHLRGAGAPVDDVRARELRRIADGPLPEAVCRALNALDPEVSGDEDLVTLVLSLAEECAA